MKILLLGRNGQLGWELQRALAPLGELVALDSRGPGLAADFSRPDSLARTVRALRPNVIVNAAAHTAVDRAEAEPDLARTINATAVGVLGREAAAIGATLVHYSSDYVFDGSGSAPRDEDAATGPLNVYGRTKLAGERAVQAAGANHLILRTSWVYGASGKNFLVTMLRLAAERDELKIVNDQIGAPTWCRDIATATSAILTRVTSKDAAEFDALKGLYNLSAQGSTSWHEFATAILAETSAAATKPRAKLVPIPTSEYPLPAARPRNSILRHDKLRRTFGVELPDWRASLKACLAVKR